jgi:hypothetical protein
MTEDFYKFPHTPHLFWLGAGTPRDDKVLKPGEAAEFLSGEIVVEEKVDGANLGISLGPSGRLRAQSRGNYLAPGKSHAQWNQQNQLPSLLGPSRAGHVPMEGIYLRREKDGCLEARAKVVTLAFKQQIEEHWTRRAVVPNRLALVHDAVLLARNDFDCHNSTHDDNQS